MYGLQGAETVIGVLLMLSLSAQVARQVSEAFSLEAQWKPTYTRDPGSAVPRRIEDMISVCLSWYQETVLSASAGPFTQT